MRKYPNHYIIVIWMVLLLASCCAKKKPEVHHVVVKYKNPQVNKEVFLPPPAHIPYLFSGYDNFILDRDQSIYYYHSDKLIYHDIEDPVPFSDLKASHVKKIPVDSLNIVFLDHLLMQREKGEYKLAIISEVDTIRNKNFKVFLDFFDKRKVNSCAIRATSEEEKKVLDTLSRLKE